MNASVLLVVDGEPDLVVDASRCDLALVERLARLQLEARRRGASARLRDVPPQLHGLLELVGLAATLCGEPLREPEPREEVGVEEVVQPADPRV
jgi:hypothetical protein